MANKKKNTMSPSIENETGAIQEDVWIPAVCHAQCVDQGCLMKVHRVNGVAVGIEPNTDIENYKNLSGIEVSYVPNPICFYKKSIIPTV